MITKVVLGKSFGGCVRYVLSKPGAELMEVNGVRNDSQTSIIKDFDLVRKLKPNVKNVVWHTSISFAYQDVVDDGLMRSVAIDYLTSMNLLNNQYLLVKHNDTKHKHFHIVANRVGLNGELVSDQWCKNKSARISDDLEIKYGLTIAQGINRIKVASKSQISVKKALKEEIRKVVEKTILDTSTLHEFIKALLAEGIHVQLQQQSTGRINGISFKSKGIAVKGSSIHKTFSYKKLISKIEENKKMNIKNERRVKNRNTF